MRRIVTLAAMITVWARVATDGSLLGVGLMSTSSGDGKPKDGEAP